MVGENMKFKDAKIRSVAEFLSNLKKNHRVKQPIWFRGQERESWSLAPTIARVPLGIKAEAPLVTRFKQNAFALLPDRPSSEWEWLFVMRHYGVPTRLLDWSESPLVGLYFAVSKEPRHDAALWALLPIELNNAGNIRPQHPADIPGFGDASVLENYLPSSLANEQMSSLLPAAAIAPRNTKRMQAQLGVFTITHRELTPIEDVGSGDHIWRYIIPKGSKKQIEQELSVLNVTILSLFPELDHVANRAKELLK